MNSKQFFNYHLKNEAILSQSDTISLLKEYKEGKDIRKKLFFGYYRLILSVALLFCRKFSEDIDDIIDSAIDGLWKAMENYDFCKSVAFSTFACKCIRTELYNSLARYRCGGKLNTRKLDNYSFVPIMESDITYETSCEVDFILNQIKDARAKRIITYRFADNMLCWEIGEKENVSKQRVSQIINECLATLRKKEE